MGDTEIDVAECAGAQATDQLVLGAYAELAHANDMAIQGLGSCLHAVDLELSLRESLEVGAWLGLAGSSYSDSLLTRPGLFPHSVAPSFDTSFFVNVQLPWQCSSPVSSSYELHVYRV